MIVISDTSIINNLAAIKQLQLLQLLYGKIVVPDAVYAELIGPPLEAGAEEIVSYDWMTVRIVDDLNRVESLLSTGLHSGESEVIALAIELDADLILVDEKYARSTAEELGLNFTGIIGILLDAKANDFIPEIRTYLSLLREGANFWISDALYQRALEIASE